MIKKKQQIITNSFEETKKIAQDFGKTLQGGEVLCMFGDLGYGKTTFIQGLAIGLGVTHKIISPTFIIMRSYLVNLKNQKSTIKNTNQNLKMFFHVDLYRINHEQEIIDLGLLDIMHDPENIVAIEWPEKMGSLLPERCLGIHFQYIDEHKRIITIVPRGIPVDTP